MTKKEFADNFVLNVEKERIALGLTQTEMADMLEMSASGYKKMISGHTAKIDSYVAYRMHTLTGKWLPELCGDLSEPVEAVSKLCRLKDSPRRFVKAIIDFEFAFQDNSDATETEDFVSLITLTGNHEDGMILDSFLTEKLNISPYRKRFGPDLHCAMRINSNHFSPVYQNGDILLISLAPPRDGDTGIFTDKEFGRTYLRRFRQTTHYILEPLNHYGVPIKIANREDMDKWIKIGRVLTRIRM